MLLAGLERARDELLTAPRAAELLLIGRRHLRDDNSWLHNSARLVKGRPRHHLLMHPDDLRARGLTDGGPVRVRSRSGEVTVEVSASEDVMPGVVSLPHGYGHDRPGVLLSVASTLGGASANDLTDPARLDELSGTAALNGVPVTVEPLR
nr:molybdopterin dinucleotide binding domain-containing protein [Nonomuraea sp. WAC 01424]